MQSLRTLSSDTCTYAEFLSTWCKFFQYKTIVELGVATGDTTLKLCEAARTNGGRVFAYDIFETCPGYLIPFSTREAVEARLMGSFDVSLFKVTKADSRSDSFTSLLKSDTGGTIDFAFIDAAHSYEGTKNDFLKVYPLLAEDGTIAIHDTYNHNGSRRFAMDLYGDLNDGTFDVMNLPYGYGNDRYGMTVLTKRTFPLYPSGITNCNHDPISAQEIYAAEDVWYKKQTR